MSQVQAAVTVEQIRSRRPAAPAAKGMWSLTRTSFMKIILNPFNLGFSFGE